ncbi:MAG: glycoside hydrolase family 3 C-terminal domain-containing protein [Christensenellales bacterium]|jgi:beta-glucosidase
MSDTPIYLDDTRTPQERAHDLVSRMTLWEKASQMRYDAPAIPHLHVQAHNWWNEALHGVARAGTATVFPQAIAMAATFDDALIHQAAEVISDEARAKHHEYDRQGDHDIYKGLTYWSPNINIFRDPRWGRGHETYGEDPYLTGRMGCAFVAGLQGDDPHYLKLVATAKHFAVHSGPEHLRHEFDAQVNEKDLWETYLPAFRRLVKQAHVRSVMGAYNRTNGEPCCGSHRLLKDILRDTWGFDGYVVSDCWAVRDFHTTHNVTASAPESAALAVKNGCDLNCGNTYLHVLTALQEGLLTEADIDQAVERLFVARMELGMFDDPSKVAYTQIPYDCVDSLAHRALALKVSQKSLVLLKNAEDLLPLDTAKLSSIAVIGPNADDRLCLPGNYNGTASEYITPLEGIRRLVGDQLRIYYAKGCDIRKDRCQNESEFKGDGLSEAVAAAQYADVSLVFLGLNETLEGEDAGPEFPGDIGGGDKAGLQLPGLQLELLKRVCAVGKPVVLVMLSGSAMDLCYAQEHAKAIVQAFYPGACGGLSIAQLLFGQIAPAGRLPVTFPHSDADLPPFTDYAMAGRTYRFLDKEPLYPFGYGLSYTRFAYDDLQVSERCPSGRDLMVSVRVTNVGQREADEVVQAYWEDPAPSAPHYQLCGFARVHLAPGQSATVALPVEARSMARFDEQGQATIVPGAYTLHVGGSQPDARSCQLTGQAPLRKAVQIVGPTVTLDR